MACTASILMAPSSGFEYRRKKENLNSCLVVEKRAEDSTEVKDDDEAPPLDNVKAVSRVEERLATEKPERYTYLVAAILSSVGITSMAAMAVHYRFLWKMEGGVVPLLEMFGTFAVRGSCEYLKDQILLLLEEGKFKKKKCDEAFLVSSSLQVGMEFWARWAHRALWHASLWHMHKSHHRPRNVPFELNDVFAIINAVPAIALFSYGFFNEGLLPGLCFGAGLGITVFGMAYMFVHDGLVHRRFHFITQKNLMGFLMGFFWGPNVSSPVLFLELEEVGGLYELDKEVQRRIKSI
uniref:beta-carotene 3-hydroxylase n=1 Tax=Salix viminalis TaxID=40686 RepID=A0A6N2KVF8_SALVM